MPGPSGHHHDDGRTLGHYVRDFLSNWTGSDAPLGRKVWLTLKNRSRSVAPPFRGCCGHAGEPGC